jgi:Protein of unknown function (DUF664)
MSSWPAPERQKTPRVTDERTSLETWLEYHRTTLLVKCAGLTPDQLVTRSCPPSALSLLGLVRHMAEVESWFHVFDGGPLPPPAASMTCYPTLRLGRRRYGGSTST